MTAAFAAICLTEFRAEDVEPLTAALDDPEIHARTLRIPYPYARADALRWLEIVAETTRVAGRPVNWAIRDAGDRLLGGIGLDGIGTGPERSHRAELGYWLARPYWGRGFMTAAVRELCRTAYGEFGLCKLTANIFADNAASARVLEKCGFEREGYLKKHYSKGGRLIDAIAFGRTIPTNFAIGS